MTVGGYCVHGQANSCYSDQRGNDRGEEGYSVIAIGLMLLLFLLGIFGGGMNGYALPLLAGIVYFVLAR